MNPKEWFEANHLGIALGFFMAGIFLLILGTFG
jgi:hypothetical protein